MEYSRQAADPEWKQLLRLGEQLVNHPDPKAQCDLIEETVGQLLSAQVRVWLASPSYPLPGVPSVETLPDAAATPIVHQALSERKIQRHPPADDASALPDNGPRLVAVPMLVKQLVLGILQAERAQGPAFNEHELSLLEGLVTHAAVAMEMTRQETLKNWRFEQLNLVRSVSAQISTLPGPEALYDRVTQLIQEMFAYDFVAIFLLDASRQTLQFGSSASRDPSTPLTRDFTIQIGEGIPGCAAETGLEIVAKDARQEARYRFLDALPATLCEAALPLKVEERVLGVLDIRCERLNAFHERDLLVLRSLASNLALAVESKGLYTKLERQIEQISSVFEVSHALISILDLDELLTEVVRLIRNRFGYPLVDVYTVHPGRRLVIHQAGTQETGQAIYHENVHSSLDDPHGMIPWVARNGRTLLSNDVSLEPLYRPKDASSPETRSELTVPLVVGEEILGVLDIQSREPGAFDEKDRSLFEALAAPVAVAIRNANLYRSEQWRRKVAESFHNVANRISSNQPLNQLMNFLLEKLESILPCDTSAIWLIQEGAPGQEENNADSQDAEPRIQLAATRNLDEDRLFEVLQDQHVLEMLQRPLHAELPLIRRPEDPLGPLGAAMGFRQDYSSIAAPMRTNQRVVGIIMLAHHQDGRYGSEAQAITATFASYAAVAIQNARLYNESQEQALISTMLLQIAEASRSILNIDDLLSTMIRLTRLLMGVKKCAFLLWDDGLQSFEIKAWYGFEPAGAAPHLFSARLPALSRLISEQAMLYLDDPAIELNLPELRLTPAQAQNLHVPGEADANDQGTIIMLPLLIRSEVIGAFLVGLQMASIPGEEARFDPKALAILQGIAHQTSLTVDNLQLQEARQEEAYVTAALLQVAQAVVTSNDLNDTLDTIVHLLPILVGIETCVIYLWDATNKLFRPTQVSANSRREEEAILARAFSPGENQLLDAIRRSGETQMSQIPDPYLPIADWGSLDCQPYDQLNEQIATLRGDWALGFPLSIQDQVMGALLVRETSVSSAFWERRMEIIHGIAQQTSLAIQNDLLKQEMVETERMEREIQLARQIQETFLPDELPQLNRWDLDMRWETAREIGGDFYDIFTLGDNRLGLVIADVADKGLPAALYMTVARTLIRASAADASSTIKVLEEANRLLVNDSTDSMFITVVYAILALDTGELRYANAGHNRPLLYRRKTGKLEQLPKGGIALGILDELGLVEHHLVIQPGDSLVLYTDGVTDLMSPTGEFFGEQRLHDVIREHGKERVQDMLEYLDDAMIEFRRGTPPVDDITLLAVRREPARRGRIRRKSNTPETGPAAKDAGQ
jgi:serine phosphatase RsbU (regulator of sigma subunit)/putative methionine-R-sulfoxide reductase with GAF domain